MPLYAQKYFRKQERNESHTDAKRHLRCTMRFDIVGGVESDHMMLRIKLRIAAFIPKKQAQEKEPAELPEEPLKKKRIRIDWQKLSSDSQLKQQFNEKLDALILEKGLSTADTPNWSGPKCFFDTFTELIEHDAYEVAPHDMKERRPTWFGELSLDELLDAIAMPDVAMVMHMKNPVEGDEWDTPDLSLVCRCKSYLLMPTVVYYPQGTRR
jgi:hypothetical protein